MSSNVECFPVVHGGIERNSSNVKTRGLQHFQPYTVKSAMAHAKVAGLLTHLLAFMEFGWSSFVSQSVSRAKSE